MIDITPQITIDEKEFQVDFVRSSGPGGQNVNKVATAVQLRFDAANSPSLPEGVRHRLLHLAGNRVTDDGVIIIDARRYRSQERNRQEAVERLIDLIRQAARPPRVRWPTRPSNTARERRLRKKRRRSEIKRQRRVDPRTDE